MLATKEGAARLAIVAVSLLIAMKVAASIVTGSIAIRADAVHSAIDLFGVIIGYTAIRIASKPPDKSHPFGHGKAENIAGVVIAVLIFIAAVIIAYQAVTRLVTRGMVELVPLGIYVTAAAIAINLLVSWYTLRVARATESIALEATARDLLADVLSSAAVLVGLILVQFTRIAVLDSIAALLVAILIGRTAFSTMKKSFGGLMDIKLPQSEEDEIVASIKKHGDLIAGFHRIRTRKAGSQRQIDFHLVVSRELSVERAHRLCDELEEEIEERLSDSSVTIHVEPCDGKCEQCSTSPDLCQPD
jgi:cation diffusion facilitator family transporter